MAKKSTNTRRLVQRAVLDTLCAQETTLKEYPGVQSGTLREKLEKVVRQLVHMGNGSEIAVAGLICSLTGVTRVPCCPVLSGNDLRLPLSHCELGIEPYLDFND